MLQSLEKLPSQDRLQCESDSASQQRASTNEDSIWCWEIKMTMWQVVLPRLQWMLEGSAW